MPCPTNSFSHRPNWQQACALLADESLKPLAIAGGTDLMARFNRNRRRRDETLVFLGKLCLDYITEEGGKVLVGACAPLSAVAASPLVREKLPLLAKACSEMASPAVRNAATLGGNAVSNWRYADGVAALIALDATVVIASTQGELRMPMADFAAAPKKQTLASGGVVRHFAVDPLAADEKWAWEKMRARKGESRSIVSVSMRARLAGGRCTDLRLVIGNMAANPFVSKKAAELLVGKTPDEALIAQAAESVQTETDPASDARASAWYRQKVTAALVRRVLAQLA